MKLTKYLVSSAAAIAVAGTLSLAYAQTTTTPGAAGSSDTTAAQQQQGAGTQPYRAPGTTTPGLSNNGNSRSGNRNADGTMRSKMNSDGTRMSDERVARADRG